MHACVSSQAVCVLISPRLVEEHTKTLEKVTELWKQKWPVNWDDVSYNQSQKVLYVLLYTGYYSLWHFKLQVKISAYSIA